MNEHAEIQAVSAQPDEPRAQQAFDSASINRAGINKVEVLNNRLVPGSDGSIEHVVIGNNAVTVIRSTPLKGRVRVTRSDVYVGGISCSVLLSGLEARVNTVRHLVGGDAVVQGALFLTKQRSAPVKRYKSILIGAPKSIIQELIDEHCDAPVNPLIERVTRELDAMFLPFDKLSDSSAA